MVRQAIVQCYQDYNFICAMGVLLFCNAQWLSKYTAYFSHEMQFSNNWHWNLPNMFQETHDMLRKMRFGVFTFEDWKVSILRKEKHLKERTEKDTLGDSTSEFRQMLPMALELALHIVNLGVLNTDLGSEIV